MGAVQDRVTSGPRLWPVHALVAQRPCIGASTMTRRPGSLSLSSMVPPSPLIIAPSICVPKPCPRASSLPMSRSATTNRKPVLVKGYRHWSGPTDIGVLVGVDHQLGEDKPNVNGTIGRQQDWRQVECDLRSPSLAHRPSGVCAKIFEVPGIICPLDNRSHMWRLLEWTS